MDLMNAPAYDEAREKTKKNVLIGSAALVVLLILLTLAGYIMGHGWLFLNLPVEHRVSTFFTALETKDYPKAYGLWYNDPDWQQHKDKYQGYPLDRFTEDWTTYSPIKTAITSHHVDISRTDGEGSTSGTIVAVRVNGDNKVFMFVSKRDGTMTWPAGHEILY